MNNYSEIKKALDSYATALGKLKDLNVITNKKDFTCQIGEWLIASLYNGKRAESGIQKDWDIHVDGQRLQVKSHAKAATTGARFSAVKYNPKAEIDALIIVVFSHDYKIKKLYRAPWSVAVERITREKHRDVIYWSHLEDYEVNLNSFEDKQNIVELFK